MNKNSKPRHGFSRHQRVRRQADFDRVYQQNVYAADNVLVVQGCVNGTSTSRLGLAVSRRAGNAVVRNRWKRSIRGAFRQQHEHLPSGLDLVARPRRGAKLSFAAIYDALPRLARRIERQLKRTKL